MIMSMATITRTGRTRTSAPETFVALCKQLYGDAVDPEVVWTDIVKLSPDQADLNAQRQARLRRNVERTSNAVGLTAGGLGTAAALRDERFKGGGKVAQWLHKTGEKLPKPLSGRTGKVGAVLAGGALATQLANIGGDVLVGQTLAKKPRKTPVDKRSIKDMVTGIKTVWGGPAFRTAPPPKPKVPPAPTSPRQQAKANQAARAAMGPHPQSSAHKWGQDVGTMLNTRSGKIATGVAGAAALTYGAKKIRQPQLTYVPDQYAKRVTPEVEWAGEFTKFDDAKRQAFGWASVVKVDGSPVLDKQGDYIELEDLEDAAYAYVTKSRVGGDMHKRDGEAPFKVSDMIESMVFTPEKIAKMGLPDGFPEGWWVGFQIHDEPTWEEVRKKGRTGFSIHGRGLRRDVDLDEIMGY